LNNQEGKKVFEHDDTIRTEFYASAYSASVGQLAHPLADKIDGRLAEAKLEYCSGAGRAPGTTTNGERELRRVAPSFTLAEESGRSTGQE